MMEKKYKRKFFKNRKKTHFLKKKTPAFTSEKAKHSYFDKLFFRIFLSSFVLLAVILFSKYTKLDLKESVLNHANIVKITDKLVGKFKDSTVVPAANLTLYETIEYIDGVNIITNENYNGVNNFESGIIVKIKKTNGLYNVTIKGKDDILYTYIGLESIDHYLYKYLETNEIIGAAPYKNGKYQFKIKISKGNKHFSLYEIESE